MRMGGCADGWMCGWVDVRICGCADLWICGLVDVRIGFKQKDIRFFKVLMNSFIGGLIFIDDVSSRFSN